MSTNTEDINFYEWLFGRADYPVRRDSITIPYPLNYKPIPVKYIENVQDVEVKYVD